jgi:hypothetical protein
MDEFYLEIHETVKNRQQKIEGLILAAAPPQSPLAPAVIAGKGSLACFDLASRIVL